MFMMKLQPILMSSRSTASAHDLSRATVLIALVARRAVLDGCLSTVPVPYSTLPYILVSFFDDALYTIVTRLVLYVCGLPVIH